MSARDREGDASSLVRIADRLLGLLAAHFEWKIGCFSGCSIARFLRAAERHALAGDGA